MKRVAGDSEESPRYLSKEIGLNRYRRIQGHDFSGGDAYQERTAAYWRAVREAWTALFEAHDRIDVASEHEGQKLFARHFGDAEELAEATADEIERAVAAVLADHVSTP